MPWRTLFALSLLWLSAAALAAQNATITNDQAAIRERPELDAKVIEGVPAGTVLRVSSQNKDGWYKVKSSLGAYGWIWQGDLFVEGANEVLNATGLTKRPGEHLERFNREEPRFFFGVGGMLLAAFAPQLSSRLQRPDMFVYLHDGIYLDVAYALKPRLRVSARYHRYSNESDVTGLRVPYHIVNSGSAFMVGLDAEISRGVNSDWFGHARVGLAIGNSIEVSVPVAPAPNSFVYTAGAWPAVMVDVTYRYLFTGWFSVIADMGIYYSEVPTFRVPNQFNGDDAFRTSTTEMTDIRVSHAGPFFALGVLFSL